MYQNVTASCDDEMSRCVFFPSLGWQDEFNRFLQEAGCWVVEFNCTVYRRSEHLLFEMSGKYTENGIRVNTRRFQILVQIIL